MGLTQVMLQVKGCEMVCKQRELIPRLRPLSPLGAEGSSAFCLPQSLHLLLLLLLRLSPLSSLSNSLRRCSARPVRDHQKGNPTQRGGVGMLSAYKNGTRSGSIRFTPPAQRRSTFIQQHHPWTGPRNWLQGSAFMAKGLLDRQRILLFEGGKKHFFFFSFNRMWHHRRKF